MVSDPTLLVTTSPSMSTNSGTATSIPLNTWTGCALRLRRQTGKSDSCLHSQVLAPQEQVIPSSEVSPSTKFRRQGALQGRQLPPSHYRVIYELPAWSCDFNTIRILLLCLNLPARDPQVHPIVTNGSYKMCSSKAERSRYTYESDHKQQSATFGSGFSSVQSKNLACMQHSDKWFLLACSTFQR